MLRVERKESASSLRAAVSSCCGVGFRVGFGVNFGVGLTGCSVRNRFVDSRSFERLFFFR